MADYRFVRFVGFSELIQLARHFQFRAVSRWVAFGILVGLASGLAAVALYWGADGLKHLVFGAGVGVHAPSPKGEPSLFHNAAVGEPRYWLLVIAPALGGLSCGMLLHYVCPQAAGGTDGFINAFHQQRATVPRRLVPVKLLASALFLGFGASAGREGPIAHIGSATGAWFGRLFNLSDRERRLLLVAGAAGGIGAIFRTPLGGALFAVEVLYRDDFEVDALVPAVLASVVAYSTFTLFFGQGAMFAVAASFPFDPLQLPLYLAMAVGCSLVGGLFVWLFDVVHDSFGSIDVWPPLRPALGGLAVGVIALLVPMLMQWTGLIPDADELLGAPAIGAGYGWLQQVLQPSGLFPLGWAGIAVLLVLAFGKMLATTLSNGSGGAGGIFGPSVVMGGMVGGAFGTAFHYWLPGVVPEPSAFAIVGMACFVGGVTHSPISTLVMASEMTGNYDLLVPIMLAEVVTVVLMQRWRHYGKQCVTRRDSPAHVEEYSLNALEHLQVADAATLGIQIECVPAGMPLPRLLRVATEVTHSVVCVRSADGVLCGVVDLEALRHSFFDEDVGALAVALDCAAPFVAVKATDSLALALEKLTASHLPQLPVRSENDPNELIGLLHFQQLLAAYSQELLNRQAPASLLTP